MKRHGYLFEQVCTFANLHRAALLAAKGKKSKESVALFLFNLENEIIDLERELQTEKWKPLPYRVFMVHDPKERRICASDFRDRVVHHGICNVLEPIFERHFISDTCACRKGKGSFSARKRVQWYSRSFRYYLKFDVHKFFDSIDHNILKVQICRKIKDRKFIRLIDKIVDHSVPWAEPGKGIPIGNLTSQHFANFYLSGLDHFIKEYLRIEGYLRYMDDMVLFADEKETLWDAAGKVESYLMEKLGLTIKKGSLILAPVEQGLSFLGFRIFPGVIRASRKGWRRFRRKTIRRERDYLSGKIDYEAFVRSAASLTGYMKQADTRNLRASFFQRPGAPEATTV
jgi:RNA-directed DNA polymerase